MVPVHEMKKPPIISSASLLTVDGLETVACQVMPGLLPAAPLFVRPVVDSIVRLRRQRFETG